MYELATAEGSLVPGRDIPPGMAGGIPICAGYTCVRSASTRAERFSHDPGMLRTRRERERKRVDSLSPSNSPHNPKILRVDLVDSHGRCKTKRLSPSNSPHEPVILRVDLVGSHGSWKRPRLHHLECDRVTTLRKAYRAGLICAAAVDGVAGRRRRHGCAIHGLLRLWCAVHGLLLRRERLAAVHAAHVGGRRH